jgi:WD40 repeat protein
MDYSPCGEYFATGSTDKSVRIYDDNMKIKVFQYNPGNSVRKGHKERINSICYHKKDSNILLSGGWDYEVFIYDTRTSKVY